MEFVFAGRNPNDFKKLMRGAQLFEINVPQLTMGSLGALRVEAGLRQAPRLCSYLCSAKLGKLVAFKDFSFILENAKCFIEWPQLIPIRDTVFH